MDSFRAGSSQGTCFAGMSPCGAHVRSLRSLLDANFFTGERKLSEAELEEQAPREGYKADGKLRETERDVIKRWKRGELRIASIGIENQSDPDAVMPLRVLAYDGAEYRAQLLKGNRKRPGAWKRAGHVSCIVFSYPGWADHRTGGG